MRGGKRTIQPSHFYGSVYQKSAAKRQGEKLVYKSGIAFPLVQL